ncbi:hypothetical protein RM553_11510 [Zunongwangia sp. F363]|uniref:Uncharacterized protein n=1 Tax=Autumnicola tepida TaxID=3075595 RepID=A0ABU3CAW2_9FLAO|nr:hypothetical protein [Zunongwangia sp. F363]MDT0643459.1 hypothetical protein [Zunongwangia sp. F363]
MKLLLRFFIAFFILLFSGLAQVSALNLHKQATTYLSQAKNHSAQANSALENNNAFFRHCNSSETKKKFAEPEETEIEESQEESNAFNKNFDNSNLETLFYAVLSKYLLCYPSNRFSLSEQTSLFSSNSPAYIRFCVLRL